MELVAKAERRLFCLEVWAEEEENKEIVRIVGGMENNRAENTGHGDTIDDSFTSLSKRLSFDYLNASFELSE